MGREGARGGGFRSKQGSGAAAGSLELAQRVKAAIDGATWFGLVWFRARHGTETCRPWEQEKRRKRVEKEEPESKKYG